MLRIMPPYQHPTADHMAAIQAKIAGRRVKGCGCVYYGMKNVSPCDTHEGDYAPQASQEWEYRGPMTAGRRL